MATVVERDILIRANPSQINSVALDGNRLPEWYAGIEKAAPDGTYPMLGGSVDVVYKAAGINFNLVMKTIEYVEGERFGLEMEGMIKGTTHWTLAPRGAERTRLFCKFEYEMPGGGLGQALNKLVVEKMNTENLEKSLQQLKSLVEA